METIPDTLVAPTFDLASSTNTQLIINWNAPTSGVETGGSSVTIDSYTLYWDQGLGTNTYVSLITQTTTSYTHTGLTGGNTYSYEVLATNKYGDGILSSSASATTG